MDISVEEDVNDTELEKENITNTESNIQKDNEGLDGSRVNTEEISEKLDKNLIIYENSSYFFIFPSYLRCFIIKNLNNFFDLT